MLIPNKHLHPDATVLATATIILKHLKKFKIVSYDDLRKLVDRSLEFGNYFFVPALSLLFILGLVDYLPKSNCFEYRGKYENK